MVQDADEGDDGRSVGTRLRDAFAFKTALQRAQEPERGHNASSPSEIQKGGWKLLWRAMWALPKDRVLTTAGGVAIFALLAAILVLVAVVSICGLIFGPNEISQHVSPLTYIFPPATLELLCEHLDPETKILLL